MEVSEDDLCRDNRSEIRRLIGELREQDTDAVQDTVYRALEFDLCMACQRDFLKNPLGADIGPSATEGPSGDGS